MRFTKKWQEGLKNEANALKSFCGSVEMLARISIMASFGFMFFITGLE